MFGLSEKGLRKSERELEANSIHKFMDALKRSFKKGQIVDFEELTDITR